MISTSTANCSYFNPRYNDGTIPNGDDIKLPFQFASSSCEYQLYDSIVGSSTPAIAGGFTNGEIIISVLLFLIFLTALFNIMVVKFLGLKIHSSKL